MLKCLHHAVPVDFSGELSCCTAVLPHLKKIFYCSVQVQVALSFQPHTAGTVHSEMKTFFQDRGAT